MEAKFSPKVKEVISYSREEALRLGHDYIGTEHLLLGLIREGEGMAIQTVKALDVDPVLLRKSVEDAIADKAKHSVNFGNIPLTKQAEKVLKITFLEAKLLNSEVIGTEHLMLSILKSKDSIAAQILGKFDVNYEDFKEELEFMLQDIKDELTNDPGEEEFEEEDRGSFGRPAKREGDLKSKTPVLDNFGRDLTKMAEDGSLDPIVGRENEIERVSQILSRRKKNNPILLWKQKESKS